MFESKEACVGLDRESSATTPGPARPPLRQATAPARRGFLTGKSPTSTPDETQPGQIN